MLIFLKFPLLMQSVNVNGLIFDEYLPEQEIATVVSDVAGRINADYAGREPLFICVLNGAFMYMSDLFKRITLPSEITFVRMKSYEGTATTGNVNMLVPLQTSVKDRDVSAKPNWKAVLSFSKIWRMVPRKLSRSMKFKLS